MLQEIQIDTDIDTSGCKIQVPRWCLVVPRAAGPQEVCSGWARTMGNVTRASQGRRGTSEMSMVPRPKRIKQLPDGKELMGCRPRLPASAAGKSSTAASRSRPSALLPSIAIVVQFINFSHGGRRGQAGCPLYGGRRFAIITPRVDSYLGLTNASQLSEARSGSESSSLKNLRTLICAASRCTCSLLPTVACALPLSLSSDATLLRGVITVQIENWISLSCPDQRRHALQEQTKNDVTPGYTTPSVNNVRHSQAGAGGTVPRCYGAFACLWRSSGSAIMGGAATSSGLGNADAPANPFLFDATWASCLFEGPCLWPDSRSRPPKCLSIQTRQRRYRLPLGSQHARIRLHAQKPCHDLRLLLQPFVMPLCMRAIASGFEHGLASAGQTRSCTTLLFTLMKTLLLGFSFVGFGASTLIRSFAMVAVSGRAEEADSPRQDERHFAQDAIEQLDGKGKADGTHHTVDAAISNLLARGVIPILRPSS
ncbi:hypothetical protein CPLU01_11605 [Colletotrichum plurivorum]|uniref:Uncharacterized protein n=1 Tax=Colletotrichum plurivorum TaxID=2175906 RepID=A0A8H6K2I7_9PEZI|nr:hypothetical protein CPLU01_11605 [Colletotrichum plurivorum]